MGIERCGATMSRKKHCATTPARPRTREHGGDKNNHQPNELMMNLLVTKCAGGDADYFDYHIIGFCVVVRPLLYSKAWWSWFELDPLLENHHIYHSVMANHNSMIMNNAILTKREREKVKVRRIIVELIALIEEASLIDWIKRHPRTANSCNPGKQRKFSVAVVARHARLYTIRSCFAHKGDQKVETDPFCETVHIIVSVLLLGGAPCVDHHAPSTTTTHITCFSSRKWSDILRERNSCFWWRWCFTQL